MSDKEILDDAAIDELEAHLKRWERGEVSKQTFPASWANVNALCQTVRALKADLKYRHEALEEFRRCRDRWLTLLNPSNPDETVDGAIRNLQQAYISERDNAVSLQSQLEQVTKERDELKDNMARLGRARAREMESE